MAEGTATSPAESPLPPAILRSLGDRSYDKRKNAALEIEALIKALQENSDTDRICSVIAMLGQVRARARAAAAAAEPGVNVWTREFLLTSSLAARLARALFARARPNLLVFARAPRVALAGLRDVDEREPPQGRADRARGDGDRADAGHPPLPGRVAAARAALL